MQWWTALAIYFVIWWICLFMVLPFGVRRVENPEAGHDAGAPEHPRIWRKFAINTGVSLIVFAIFYAVYVSGLITFE